MSLYLYVLSIFLVTFLIEMSGIIIIEKRKKNTDEISIEQEYKNNMKFIAKIIIALIIAIIIGIISFYGFGIAILIGLREGH